MAKYILQHRRGTTEAWQETDIILRDGEIAIEDRSDGTRGIIVGDGVHTYNELSKMYLQQVWTLNLPAENWEQMDSEVCEDGYHQFITLSGTILTPYTKVDLQPTETLISMLRDEEITLTTKNVNGEQLCVVAIGGAPSQDIEVQATKTEVILV